MDVLGNWSGNGFDSFREYDDVGGDWTFDSTDPAEFVGSFYQNHDSDAANRIGTLEYDTGNGAQSAKFIHDAAGNIVVDRDKYYVYDAWNRLVKAYQKGTNLVDPVTGDFDLNGYPGLPIAKYTYDALGRRIEHVLHDATGAPTQTDRFYYDGKRIIEHHRNGSLHRQYVYGLNYINEPVAYYDPADTTDDPHYILQDANYNVVAVADKDGILEQQYSYWPYGAYIAIEDGLGGAQTESDLLLPFGFQGMFGLHEINAYAAGPRIVSTYSGNWYQRDPNGTGVVVNNALAMNAQSIGASSSLSPQSRYDDGMHLYGYVRSNPLRFTDPTGTTTYCCQEKGVHARWDLPDLVPGLQSEVPVGRSLKARLTAMIDFRIKRNFKVTFSIAGPGATGPDSSGDLFTFGIPLMVFPSVNDVAGGLDRKTFTKINLLGTLCLVYEQCARVCNNCRGNMNLKTQVKPDGPVRERYGSVVRDEISGLFRCQPAEEGQAIHDPRTGKYLGSGRPPIRCDSSSVPHCDENPGCSK